MKVKLLFITLTLLAFYSCKDASANEIHVVTTAEMNNYLKYDDVQVVDVQPSDEYSKSHLLNAKNIIYDEDFRKNLSSLDKSKPVAIYCTTGKVSPKAAEILREAGFKNIYVLEGGIKKWHQEYSTKTDE